MMIMLYYDVYYDLYMRIYDYDIFVLEEKGICNFKF